jgi:Glycosyltransferase sugar-binding region containing DXD motif
LPAESVRSAIEGVPIVQYWHAEQPPERICAGLASFSERNSDLPHLVFDETTAEAFIAAHFSAREVAAFRSCTVPAMQSDYFRYCAILVLGGLYADADLRCVADLRPLIEERGGTLFGRQGPLPEGFAAALRWPYQMGAYLTVCNSPFTFREPGHPLLELAVKVATANVEHRIAEGARGVWLTAGPGVFTSMYLLHRLGSVEAFLRYATGTVLEPSAPLFCEIVGSHSTIARVMTGVAIRSSKQEAGAWVRALGKPEPGEDLTPHWMSAEGNVFR